jgi:hypothetical protein
MLSYHALVIGKLQSLESSVRIIKLQNAVKNCEADLL